MEPSTAIASIWWLGAVLWLWASKSDSDRSAEGLEERLAAAEARAADVERVAARLKEYERVTMLAHLVVREAREKRGGVRAPPSQLERTLAARLGNICKARQEVAAIRER